MDLLLPSTFYLENEPSRKDVFVGEAEKIILGYYREHWAYEAYDGYPIAQDDRLSDVDILIVNNILEGRGKSSSWKWFSSLRDPQVKGGIEDALAKIIPPPEGQPVEDNEATRHAVQELFGAVLECKGVGPAVATKLIHKKRPAVIPIMDKVLGTVYGIKILDTRKKILKLWCSFVADLGMVWRPVCDLSDILGKQGYILTPLRVFEFALWLAARRDSTVLGSAGSLLRRRLSG